MSFTSKNLQSTQRSGISFLKGATLFFLGMSVVMFMTQAFQIVPSVRNAKQYIQEIIFTADGYSDSLETVTIDGDGGNAYFAGKLGIGTTDPNHNVEIVGLSGESVSILAGEEGSINHSTLFLNANPSVSGMMISNVDIGGAINMGIITNYKGNLNIGNNSAIITNTGGNVGIGGTPSTYKLEVTGTGKFSQGVCLGNDCRNTWPEAGGESVWMTGASNVAYYNQGNVGIGTDDPTEKFQVSSYAQIGDDSSSDTGGNFLRIHSTYVPGFEIPGQPAILAYYKNPNIQLNRKSGQIQGNNKNRKIENNGTLKFDYATGSYDYDTKLSLSTAGLMTLDGNIRLETGGLIYATPNSSSNQLYLDYNGRVGIGTDEPTAKLHVYGGTLPNEEIATFESNGGILEIEKDSNSIVIQNSKGADGSTSNAHLEFRTYTPASGVPNYALNENQLFLHSSGNVGIGTDAPSAPFHVKGPGTGLVARLENSGVGGKLDIEIGDSEILIRNTVPTRNMEFGTHTSTGFYNQDQLRLLANGNVGLGVNDPKAKLSVNGGIQVKNPYSTSVSEGASCDSELKGTMIYQENTLNSPSVGRIFVCTYIDFPPLTSSAQYQWRALDYSVFD